MSAKRIQSAALPSVRCGGIYHRGGMSAVPIQSAAQIFKAQPRETDGKVPWSDLLLEYLTTLVFQLPESGTVKGVTVTAKWKGSPTPALFLFALGKKHLAALDSKGNRKPTKIQGKDRGLARELMLDVLANKENESWRPYAGIFAAFAGRDDKDFFECLVRARQRKKRKQIFSPLEIFLMGNWLEWNQPPFQSLTKCPPLRWWTDQAVIDLLEAAPPGTFGKKPVPKLAGLRTMRTRLALPQAKPERVLRCIWQHGDIFRIHTRDQP